VAPVDKGIRWGFVVVQTGALLVRVNKERVVHTTRRDGAVDKWFSPVPVFGSRGEFALTQHSAINHTIIPGF
jgi:hypothetical protein